MSLNKTKTKPKTKPNIKTRKKQIRIRNNTGYLEQINQQIRELLDSVQVVGLGDFTHGCPDIQRFVIQFLEYLIKNTDKPIKLFTENSGWRADNIMKHPKLRFMKPRLWNNRWPVGKLGHYVGYGGESPECLEFIKFIRANRARITIIGADPDIIDRDEIMAKTILTGMYPKGQGYNIWYAANHHVDIGKYELMNQKWVPNPERVRYYAGWHLKQALGRDYAFIISQGYQGTVRYNGICLGDDCADRIVSLDYIWRDFVVPEFKRYTNRMQNIELLGNAKFQQNKLAVFNASYHARLTQLKPVGQSGGLYDKNNKGWTYILFFNKVGRLEPLSI